MKINFLFLLLVLVACEQGVPPSVSLMDLVINGDEYDGERVIVTGFYLSGLEESALYFSKEQSDYGMVKDAVWVDIGEDVYWQNFPDDEREGQERLQSLSGKYLSIEGVFEKRSSNKVGVFGGTIVADRIFLTRKRGE